MTVSEILSVIPFGTVVQVEQVPIKRIDTGETPVLRQYADVKTLSDSKQNYLNFEVVRLCQVCGILTIRCKANAEQEMAIISARYSGC